MTVTCPKCGREIKNAGALRMHEASCKGTGSTGESSAQPPAVESGEKPSTSVKSADGGQAVDSSGESTGEKKKGFFQGIEDELNA